MGAGCDDEEAAAAVRMSGSVARVEAAGGIGEATCRAADGDGTVDMRRFSISRVMLVTMSHVNCAGSARWRGTRIGWCHGYRAASDLERRW